MIPKKLRIAGLDFDVRFSRDICVGGLAGAANEQEQDIIISSEQPHEQQIVTFLHETLHMIQRIYNIPVEAEVEEIVIDGFAHGLFQVLKDNKSMSQLLVKAPTKK